MQWEQVHASAFPIEGSVGVGLTGIVGGGPYRAIVPIRGKSCVDCGERFAGGEAVTLIKDRAGMAWVHDAHIRQEAEE